MTVMHSAVDVAGVNRISREIYTAAASPMVNKRPERP
jgi:uncharacterized protein (UPF0261 family)